MDGSAAEGGVIRVEISAPHTSEAGCSAGALTTDDKAILAAVAHQVAWAWSVHGIAPRPGTVGLRTDTIASGAGVAGEPRLDSGLDRAAAGRDGTCMNSRTAECRVIRIGIRPPYHSSACHGRGAVAADLKAILATEAYQVAGAIVCSAASATSTAAGVRATARACAVAHVPYCTGVAIIAACTRSLAAPAAGRLARVALLAVSVGRTGRVVRPSNPAPTQALARHVADLPRATGSTGGHQRVSACSRSIAHGV
jgi:hypothetical protein